MAKKNVRNMKVCGQSGYKYDTVPAITLKGKWLEELGFHLGDYVQVKCENGQLIITPDVNKAQEQEAKTAFMDEEIKKLKVRSRLNDRLQISGILLTMCDARTNLCKVITEQLTETFDGQIRIFKSIIPNTVKVGESIYYSEPLLEYAPENKACKAYRNLAEEVAADES